MGVFSLVYLFCFCFLVELLDAQFDGQASCAWGKSRSKRSPTTWFSSSSVNEKNVHFLFYNKDRILYDTPYPTQLFIDDESSLQKGDFDVKKPTNIFIHGYKSHYNKSASRLVRDGFLKRGDFNVIVIDWSANQHGVLNVLLAYDAVVIKLDAVAELVSRFLQFLERYGVDLSTTTIVGHSLGAHIAGLASHKAGSKVGRIVGLDPAKPLLSKKSIDERLSKDDAKQVEVIHTEIDQCGLKNQMGHYDFYPNSGRLQPGCSTYHCSHARSYRYFAESLDPQSKGFYGKLCEDWWAMQEGNCTGEIAVMGGLHTKTTPHGLYYVQVNADAPYSQGRS
ncbi:phospholipase A1-like isoform X1 [Phymastichus coffea]|uniref:phospholipase A1-like isoform X1 n=1 Tax=Phymastichus coffea TaxID=108790 RepID=UPI00273B8F66|nr:phospholipase A1-like isoform X1 [Phymastichus coffea]